MIENYVGHGIGKENARVSQRCQIMAFEVMAIN